MDLLEWIAASKRMTLPSDQDVERLREGFHRLRPRGFITDFTAAPIVARAGRRGFVLSRQSSFWGRQGPRCVVRIVSDPGGDRQLDLRMWHGPIFTAWLVFSYALAGAILVFALLASVAETNSRPEHLWTAGGALLVAAFWVMLTAVLNALKRAREHKSIDALRAAVEAIAAGRSLRAK